LSNRTDPREKRGDERVADQMDREERNRPETIFEKKKLARGPLISVLLQANKESDKEIKKGPAGVP